MAFVIMIDLYLAERSSTKRPEIFYLVGGFLLFGALLVASGLN
jgi:hypothetical protein